MSNAVFPALAGLMWGTDWEPEFSTKIQTSTSGKEYRSSFMSSPVYNFKFQYEFLRANAKQELQTLFGFFLARRGSFDNFLLDYQDDDSVTNQIIGIANGAQNSFQLLRGFTPDFAEPVQNINMISNVSVNGVTKNLGADYTVNSTGLVTFNSAPNTGNVTWTGTYYYRCRFADDKLTFTNLLAQLYEGKQVDVRACLGTKI